MKHIQTGLVFALLLSFSLAGCISEDAGNEGLDLQVDYDLLNGTIVETYNDGELVSLNSVTIEFDFSKTTSDNKLSIFGIDTNDSRTPIEVNANETSIVSVDFVEHGLYELTLYAIDSDNNQANLSLTVRIDLTIDWTESYTDEPQILTFDPRPSNGGQHPVMIEIESTVENPELITELGNGESVDITWNIVDEYDDTCQRNGAQIANGDQGTWNTIHFNTYLVHELIVEFDEDQDTISIHHWISIIYDE